MGPVLAMLISHLVSVVVTDLDVVGVPVDEPEADPPLVVDRDRVLASAVAFQCVEPIAGWNLQVVDLGREVHILELAAARPATSGGNRLARPVS